jgi:hypothetical protein
MPITKAMANNADAYKKYRFIGLSPNPSPKERGFRVLWFWSV